MYGALNSKSGVGRLYIRRKEGDRGPMSAESCVREEEKGVSCYVFNSEKNFIRRVAAAETINTEDTVTSKKIRKQKAQELKQNQSEKKMHRQFVWQMSEKVDKDKTWQ